MSLGVTNSWFDLLLELDMNLFGLSVGIGAPFKVVLPDEELGLVLGVTDREEEEGLARFKVWGMTARVLVDAARIAYGEEAEMEHNAHYGDEEIIRLAEAEGSFEDEPAKAKKSGEEGPSKI